MIVMGLDYNVIGSRIKEARLAKNMTQEERDAMISNMGEAFNKMLELYGYDEESFKNLSKEKLLHSNAP